MMKIKELLNWAEERLREAGIEDAKRECEIFLEEELKLNRSNLYLNLNKTITFDINSFKNKIMKRITHFPFAYILGKVQFMGLEFLVDKRVMIPRQETELLIEAVLNHINSAINRTVTIVDIGTGCGNIAITLAKNIADSKIYAIDISEEALEVAQDNAKRNGVSGEKISFFRGNLLKPLNKLEFFGKIDIIVFNPPYIPSGEIENLQQELRFEPEIALDGGFDGMEFYRRIVEESPLYLKNGGYLFLEVGFNQIDKLRNLISKNKIFVEKNVVSDYSGIERVIGVQKWQNS